jgi:hypothetical protein
MRRLHEIAAGLPPRKFSSLDAYAAADWATPPSVLDVLSRHCDPEVRLAVASNLMASAEAVEQLAKDTNDAVALAAIIHPIRDLSAQEVLDLRILQSNAAAEHFAGGDGPAVRDFMRRATEVLGPWPVRAAQS